jgi:dephospho-CoA kinase
MTVIVVVGLPGSGKEVLVNVARELGFKLIRMGDVVRKFATDIDVGTGDSEVGGFADHERKVHGNDIWAIRTLESLPSGNVVIDGSRSLFEIKRFKKTIGQEVVVTAVRAPEEQRYQRLRARGREDDPITLKDFQARDEREISWGILEAIDAADIILMNDATLDEFRDRCLLALKKLA